MDGLPPRLRPRLMDSSTGIDPVVCRERIGLSITRDIFQEGGRTVSFANGRVVIHCVRNPPGSTTDPEPGRACLRQGRIKDGDWCVVGVNDCRAADPLDHLLVQWIRRFGRLQRSAAECAA